jgi:hypothetical protein
MQRLQHSNVGQGKHIRTLFSLPFQRIFVYKNIVEKCLQCTPKTSSLYSILCNLGGEIDRTLLSVNSAQRLHESTTKKAEIGRSYPSLRPILSKDYRMVELDGTMELLCSNSNRISSYVVLFSDSIAVVTDRHLYHFYILLVKVKESNLSLVIDHIDGRSVTLSFSHQMTLNLWALRIKDYQQREIGDLSLGVTFDPENFMIKYHATTKLIPTLGSHVHKHQETSKQLQDSIANAKKDISDLLNRIPDCISNYQACMLENDKHIQLDPLKDAMEQFHMMEGYQTVVNSITRGDDESVEEWFQNDVEMVKTARKSLGVVDFNVTGIDRFKFPQGDARTLIDQMDPNFASIPENLVFLKCFNEMSIHNQFLKDSVSDLQNSNNYMQNKMENMRLLQSQTYQACLELMENLKTQNAQSTPINYKDSPSGGKGGSFGESQSSLIHNLLDQTCHLKSTLTDSVTLLTTNLINAYQWIESSQQASVQDNKRLITLTRDLRELRQQHMELKIACHQNGILPTRTMATSVLAPLDSSAPPKNLNPK